MSALATDEDYATEFLDLKLAVRVVDTLDAAIAHITRYGSGHSEAIVTDDLPAADRFCREVDAAAVLVNASTRFVDGEELGFGAEIGISTQKLHARGPMGLRELTTTQVRHPRRRPDPHLSHGTTCAPQRPAEGRSEHPLRERRRHAVDAGCHGGASRTSATMSSGPVRHALPGEAKHRPAAEDEVVLARQVPLRTSVVEVDPAIAPRWRPVRPGRRDRPRRRSAPPSMTAMVQHGLREAMLAAARPGRAARSRSR